ncbi:MAG: hypothetical protein AB7J13_12275 [Pyrinomonadaceae bacterium]
MSEKADNSGVPADAKGDEASLTADEKPRKKRPPRFTKKQLKRLQLRDKVLDLYEMGASIRQIAERLQSQGEKNCSRSTVHNLILEGLDDIRKNLTLRHEQLVQRELNKLDKMELALLPNVMRLAESDSEFIRNGWKGDGIPPTGILKGVSRNADEIEKLTRAIDRIWKRRDSLLGLHKPLKVDIDPRKSLAKLLGRDPEEFPDGDPDS